MKKSTVLIAIMFLTTGIATAQQKNEQDLRSLEETTYHQIHKIAKQFSLSKLQQQSIYDCTLLEKIEKIYPFDPVHGSKQTIFYHKKRSQRIIAEESNQPNAIKSELEDSNSSARKNSPL